jgi:hypothetical protein
MIHSSQADKIGSSQSDGLGRSRWLENYCKANPLESMQHAAVAMRTALIARSN